MIIISSKIITCKRSTTPVDKAAIVINNRGIIQAVGPVNNISRCYPGHHVVRLENSVLTPGLVNVHTHLELPHLLDTIRAKTFPDWVLNLIRVKKNLNQKDYASSTEDNINLLTRTGTTAIGEISTHGISPDLLKKSHLRAVIFHEVISTNALPRLPRLSPVTNRPSPLIQAGISPHSPCTVSKAVLQQIKRISQDKNLPLCMHVAESKDEIKLLQRKKSGLEKIYQLAGWDIDWAPRASSSFEYLNKIRLLSPNLLAVHAVQATDKDIKLIKRLKVCIAHCPRSNKKLGVGRMPLKKFLDAGITVGLGTDSLASSPSLSMWDEMRYALRIHKKDGISARDIFELATIGGAKALGLGKEIGTLEPGKKADIIAVPLPSKNTGDIYSDLLRETKSCIMTMVNGKILHLDADYR